MVYERENAINARLQSSLKGQPLSPHEHRAANQSPGGRWAAAEPGRR
jgi:hypothetical protein